MARRFDFVLAVVFTFTVTVCSLACAQATATNVSVNSALVVNPTGVQVTAGQKLQITASGTVNIADKNGPYYADPNGTITVAPASGTGAYTYFTNDAGPVGVAPAVGAKKTILSGGQITGAPYAALVAGFSSNPGATAAANFPNGFVLVGSSATITAPISGYLFLAVNDVNNTYDNVGSFSAIVTGANPPIASVEFTQVIQQYQTLADLKTSLTSSFEPPVPLVSGKPAVMRIYFNDVPDVVTYTVQMTGAVTGSKTYDIWPGCSAKNQRAGDALCTSMDFYFTPPSGTWTTSLTVTDSMNNQLEQESFVIASRDTMTINLKGVSGCATGAVTACGKVAQLLTATGLTNQLWPTATVTPHVTPEKVTLNAQATLNSAGLANFISIMVPKIDALYSPTDASSDSANNARTAYVGIYPQAIGNAGAIAQLPGHGLLIGEALPGTKDITPQPDYLAHEFGHTINERHTNKLPPVVPAPLTPPGCYDTAVDPDTTWPFANNEIQSGAGQPASFFEYGFNVATQTIINPTTEFDIMAYCVPDWVSPINYKLAFTLLGGGTVGSPSVREPEKASMPATPLAAPLTVQGQYWQVGGSIGTAGLTLGPIFTETIQGTTDSGSGAYTIEALSGTGQILYTRFFTPTPVEPDPFSTSVMPAAFSDFSEWIPVTAGTASIAVADGNGTVLTSVPITGTAPMVAITSPVAGFVGSGVQSITWTIQSATATSSTSRIFYSIDGGTTWQQLDELTGTTDTFDFSTLPGATAALFRVDVSDGVNTGSATSVPFSVPKKVPSTIVINNPINGAVQPAANPVYLSGAAYDADDGVLTGNALQWSDNAQGALGSGSPLSVSLNPGPHTITLTATDSDGNAITATTNITLGGGRPVVTLSTDTLSANCVSATIGATPGNQGAALSTVQYSLDGGATYTSIPLAELPYSFVIPGSASVNLVAVAADLSKQTAAQSTQVTLTGACTTGVPSVSGGSTQTAVVGGAFATPLTALVSDSNGNPVAGVAVNFTAPATDASATLTPATATTSANGIASANATANSTNGNYTVVATVPGFSTTAQFSLTNTDFTMALDNTSLTIKHGSTGTATVTLAPLSGFNSAITLGCTGLPEGVTCSFAPSSVTPAGSSATSTLTVTAARDARAPKTAMLIGVEGGGLVFAVGLIIPGLRRRRRALGIFMILALAISVLSATGCGGFKSFTTPITVTAGSGAATHSTSLTITVQ